MDFPYKKKSSMILLKSLKLHLLPRPHLKNPEYGVIMQIRVISKSLSTSQETSPALWRSKTCKAIVLSYYFGKC